MKKIRIVQTEGDSPYKIQTKDGWFRWEDYHSDLRYIYCHHKTLKSAEEAVNIILKDKLRTKRIIERRDSENKIKRVVSEFSVKKVLSLLNKND